MKKIKKERKRLEKTQNVTTARIHTQSDQRENFSPRSDLYNRIIYSSLFETIQDRMSVSQE